MKPGRLFNKFDDWLNPIAVKELRQAVKSRIVVSALTLFLLIQLSILLLILSFSAPPTAEAARLNAGRSIFYILQGILLGACMLLVPAYAGVRLAAEHTDTNVDLLFISTLRPRRIIAGKLQAAVVLILLIFSACAPFMTFTYLLRGIDIPSIILVLAIDFLTVLLGTQTAIFLGAIPANATLRRLLGLFGLSVLVVLFSYAMAGSIALLEMGWGSRVDTVEFWLVVGGAVVALVAVIGLLFTWSVAIISPPSANRALPVRLYMLGFWLVTGGVAALLAHHFRSPIPLYCWQWVVVTILCVQFLVAINEREQWGLRVRRMIPRRWWLRGPLFLLYSGSAGGILFTGLLLASTIALPSTALEYWSAFFFTSSFGSMVLDFNRPNTLALALFALYTFDYCMLAVWLRNVLLRGQIQASYTWVLALILWGLGFSLPYLLLFLFQNEELRAGHIDPWWQISNPFATIYTCMEEQNTGAFSELCLLFLGGLGSLLLLACAPWMARQIRRFRPPEKECNPPKIP
jgi:hypothetical protein